MILPIVAGAVLIIAILGLVAHATASPEQKAARQRQQAARKAKAARYCTKHVITSSPVPGGPDHLSWVYGSHRTQGNACDGPEHRRTSGWW
jgi:hypothetical protein